MLASIPSPPVDGFEAGPLDVRAYGLAYAVAMLAAVLITTRPWTAVGGHSALVIDVVVWGVPAGLIGGRLYFLATSWDEFRRVVGLRAHLDIGSTRTQLPNGRAGRASP